MNYSQNHMIQKYKCFLDTNILLYFILESSKYFEETRDLILSMRADNADICISPLVLDEFIYQLDFLTRKGDRKRKDYYELAQIFTHSVTSIPGAKILEIPSDKSTLPELVRLMKKYNLKPRDAYHLLTMLENGVDYIATYDKDFDKVIESGIIRKYN
ncbi:PIN domain-containing protein [Candidatus Dojkabacteria bacterium]|nr:PIN domain-containing protein [Candidatus Dojkabacteria bacterium]